jgi:mitochondrial import receptor subunit TOM40
VTFPALFQIEGVKVDIASILSENFNIVHSFQWGSQNNPGVYQFGATFTDPKFVIGGQLDHAGTLNGKFCYNWIPIPVPSHNPETPREPAPEVTSTTKIQGQSQMGSNQKVLVFEHEHLGKDYSLSLRATNPVLFGKRSEQIMSMIPENYSIGFLQSISPSFIIGGELTIPKGGNLLYNILDLKSITATYALKYVPSASKIEPPPVLPEGIPSPYMPVNPKDPTEALTLSLSPSSGLIQTSYWKKINQRLEVATEVQLLADPASGRREGIAMLGWKLDTLFASIRSSIDTQGRISTVLEERIAPGISLQLSADMNYGKSLGGEGKVGIGFTMEQ